jgi:hypothetical protein
MKRFLSIFIPMIIISVGFAFGTEALKISAGELQIVSATEISYSGGILLQSYQYTVSASSVEIFFNAQRHVVKAIFDGNVVYTQGQNVIHASEMVVFFEKDLSLINDLRGSVKIKNAAGVPQNVYFFGQNSIYNTKSGTTTIYSGYITTCTANPPHYEMAASKIELVPGDHLIAYNIVLYLFGIPIFYFPEYYYSLAGGRQPMQFSINYAGAQGWYTTAQFNFSPSANFIGDVYTDSYTNGPTTRGISLAGTALNVPYTFSYSDTYGGGAVTSQILKFGLSGALSKLYNASLNYQDQITGSASSQSASLALSGSALGGTFAAQLNQSVSGANQSYTLPYQLQNMSTKIGSLSITGNLNGNTGFSLPSNTFSTSHSISGNFSLPMKFLTLNSITGSYSGSLSGASNQPLSYSTLMDASYAFSALNYSFAGFKLSTSYGAATGFALSSNYSQLPYRIALMLNPTLSYNLFGLGLSAAYNYTEVTGQNLSLFSNNSLQNNVGLTANYTFPVIPLSAQAQVSYYFNNPSSPWSNIALTTSSKFNTFGINNVFNTSSVILPTLSPVNTQFSLQSNYGGISYYGQTTYNYGYNYNSNSPLVLSNQLTANLGNVSFLSNLQFASNFSFDILPSQTFVWPVPITLSANIPALNLGFSAQGNVGSNFQVQTMTLNFTTTDNDCLGLKGTIVFNTQNGFNFSQFGLTLFLTAFPEKYIYYDPVQNNFNFALF